MSLQSSFYGYIPKRIYKLIKNFRILAGLITNSLFKLLTLDESINITWEILIDLPKNIKQLFIVQVIYLHKFRDDIPSSFKFFKLIRHKMGF